MTGTRSHPFCRKLREGVLLADGGMGTMFYRRGISFAQCFDALNFTDRELVLGIHRDYLAAGADLIETNTFGGNRTRLASHGLQDRVRDVNYHGVKLAREAREIEGRDVFIAGSVGPLGKNLTPLGTITHQQASEIYTEQIAALLEGGVDLFVVETISDFDEMAIAVAAIRSLTSDLPIVAALTFTEVGMTLTGKSPEDAATFLAKLDVDVIGANCSVGPQGMLEVIHRLSQVADQPLAAMPNAGMPQLIDGRFTYAATPEYFAGFVGPFLAHGVRVLGGCCGTTPDHIAAMGAVLADWDSRPGLGSTRVSFVSTAPDEPAEDEVDAISGSSFAEDLGKRFQISVELDPPRGTNPAKIIAGARLCRAAGVDAVNIADSPMARVRMSAIAIAALVEREVGIETILHFTCRDRNLMGIQSDLIGAHALGVRNVLAVTGDPPSVGDYPHVTGVYDVDAIGLTRVLASLNRGRDFAGSAIGRATNFTIGVALNPVAEDWERELNRFREKIEAGAQFAFTQPLYGIEQLERCLDAIGPSPVPIFLGLLPLMSFRHAFFMHNEVPGIMVPDADLEAIKAAGDGGAKVGVANCRKLLEQARGMVDGVYLMPSFGRYETCLEVVEGFVESNPLKAIHSSGLPSAVKA